MSGAKRMPTTRIVRATRDFLTEGESVRRGDRLEISCLPPEAINPALFRVYRIQRAGEGWAVMPTRARVRGDQYVDPLLERKARLRTAWE